MVSPKKIITSVNHLITRGALSPTTLFACEAHELYTFTRKIVGPPASQNTFPISTGRNVVHCTSAKENMKSSNQIALLRGTKTIYTVALLFLRRDSFKRFTMRTKPKRLQSVLETIQWSSRRVYHFRYQLFKMIRFMFNRYIIW